MDPDEFVDSKPGKFIVWVLVIAFFTIVLALGAKAAWLVLS